LRPPGLHFLGVEIGGEAGWLHGHGLAFKAKSSLDERWSSG